MTLHHDPRAENPVLPQDQDCRLKIPQDPIIMKIVLMLHHDPPAENRNLRQDHDGSY